MQIFNAQYLSYYVLRFILRMARSKSSPWKGICQHVSIECIDGDLIIKLEAEDVELCNIIYQTDLRGEKQILFSGVQDLEADIPKSVMEDLSSRFVKLGFKNIAISASLIEASDRHGAFEVSIFDYGIVYMEYVLNVNKGLFEVELLRTNVIKNENIKPT